MKFSKIMTATVIAVSVLLAGCGDEEKSPDQIKFEHDKEMLAMKLAHEREMARIEVQKEQAEHQVSHTYVENEYETKNYEQAPTQSSEYVQQPTPSYSDSQVSQSTAPVEQGESVPQQAAQSEDSGYGAGSMILAAAGGALAGYAASEMLDNGMRSYQDDQGRTHYTDKNGKPITKAMYEEKRKTSKVTQFKEKAKVAGAKAKELGSNAVDKTKNVAKAGAEKAKTTYSNVKANPKVQKAVTATKYQAKKAKVLTKKQVRKAQRAARKVSRKRR